MTITQALYEVSPNPKLNAVANDVGIGGLRTFDGRAFPLQCFKVRAQIAGPCASTVIEQRFTNPFSEVLDATWIFPLPSDGALVALELRAGDVRVIGECQKREEALAQFEQARADGKRTALVETEQKGVHTLSIAGLPPKSDVVVQLTVVELLPTIDTRFRWQFPTTIAPRYTPGNEIGHSGMGSAPDTDVVPNASRLTPPLRLSGGTMLDLEVEIAGSLSTLESSLHAVKLYLDSGSVRIAPSASATLNRDFILEFSVAETSTPVTRAFTDGTYTALIIEPPTDMNVHALPRDAVFVVDISGSMEGDKLTAAKAALAGALHGLNRNDRFRLLAFDDRVDQFHADFLEYNDTNVQAADHWISKLAARGGTEMLAPIQESLRGDTPVGRVRTVLFITDGQSNDEARLLPAVANRRGNALFFTLGIDTAVNDALLKTLARAGGGVCELCTPSDDIDAVVAKLETRFGTPLLSDIRVDGAARPDGQTVFSGRPATTLIQGSADFVIVHAISPTGEFKDVVTPEKVGFSLGPIWARERVSWLEERLALRPFEEEAIKPEIERIALEHHIASKFTSFVCVDHSVRTLGERRHVIQPAELPAQWDAQAFGGAQHAAFARPSGMMLASPLPVSMYEDLDDSTPGPMSAMHADEPGIVTGSGHGFSLRESVGTLFSELGDGASAAAPKRARKAAVQESSRESVAVPLELKRSNFAGILARSQNADGSFGNDIGRSAAALLVLLHLGSTRTEGNRRRVVVKLVAWLETHRSDNRARMALAALHTFESAGDRVPRAEWTSLTTTGPEGAMLAELLHSAS